MTAALVIAIAGTGANVSERGSANLYPVATTPRSETCRSARVGLAFYRGRYVDWRRLKGLGVSSSNPVRRARQPRSCADARYLADVWRSRSFAARQATERHLSIVSRLTLRDFEFRDGNHAWHKAVRQVQRVFPGTESWLLSCSDAEGGHGRWVGYSGVAYSTWLRDSDTVGGPMQFRFSTFTGMFGRGVNYVRERGFRVPRELGDMTTAWRSALGQAIAAGWARYTGNDNSHWSASWGRGC